MKGVFYITLAVVLLVSCTNNMEEKPKPPATQSNPVKEADLNTITLTEKAVERLGIRTVEVVDQAVGNSRSFSGEVVAIPGKTVTLTAPVAGTLMPSRKNIPLSAGQRVTKGQQIARLVILPTERDLLSVQADVTQRQIQYDVAVEKVKRNKQLFEEKAGSQRAMQEAESELAAVAAQLNVARNRVELLKGNPSPALADRMSTLEMQAPISGIIQRVYTSTSQVVATGAPIADLVSLQTLWLRVPVYAGDESQINARESALIRGLSDFGGSTDAVTARPVVGPQTSDPLASSVDLYYEISNSNGSFRPGQRVSVTLPYKGNQSAPVIPFSAILYDIYGGTWVYENTAPLTYVRRRVEVLRITNGIGVLQKGPAAGTKIVTDGAAELFGTEFGGGK
ncbi:MAG: efflux RND transporter periplasmic adaptor subunit [Chitinophagaceae bacterium]